MGIDRALSKAAQAEIVLGVVDAAASLAPEVSALTDCAGDTPHKPDGIAAQIEKIVSVVDLSRQKLVLLLNKCDKAESATSGAAGPVSPRSGLAPSCGQTLQSGQVPSDSQQAEPDSLADRRVPSCGQVPVNSRQAAPDSPTDRRAPSCGQILSGQVPSNPQYAVSASGSVGRSMELKAFLRGRFPAVTFFDEISSGGISDRGVPGEGVLNDKLSDGGIPKGRISEDVVSTGRFSDHLDSNDVILAYNKNVSYVNINVLSADYQKNNPTVLSISAKYGIGLEDLRKVLVSLVGNVTADGVLVTNARHAAALRDAAASLRAVRSGLDALPGDLLAEDLRAALASLGSITGEICPEEVLGAIFSRFCIGK